MGILPMHVLEYPGSIQEVIGRVSSFYTPTSECPGA